MVWGEKVNHKPCNEIRQGEGIALPLLFLTF
jgi:hypothetical protein